MARLKDKYLNEVVPGLQEKFNYTNVMTIPKLDKVTLNIGLFVNGNRNFSNACSIRFRLVRYY